MCDRAQVDSSRSWRSSACSRPGRPWVCPSTPRRPSRWQALAARSSRADNWWHADVRAAARCTRAAGSGSRTCRPTVDLHPDFGPSYGDGPDYGIPITVVGGGAPQGPGRLHLRRARATGCATRSARDTRIEGGRGSDGDRHAIIVDTGTLPALRDSSTPGQRRPLAGRLRGGVVAAQQRAAPRRLDLRRRRRPADPARAAALERGARPAASTTPSGSPPTSPAATTSGRPATTPARRRQPGLPADGCPVPAQGVVPTAGLRPRRPRWSWRR